MGGSQGAQIFGLVIPTVIKMIKNAGYEIEVNQQCIIGQKDSLIDFYRKNNIKNYFFEFDKNILKLVLSIYNSFRLIWIFVSNSVAVFFLIAVISLEYLK